MQNRENLLIVVIIVLAVGVGVIMIRGKNRSKVPVVELSTLRSPSPSPVFSPPAALPSQTAAPALGLTQPTPATAAQEPEAVFTGRYEGTQDGVIANHSFRTGMTITPDTSW